jgi:hypothetical protein
MNKTLDRLIIDYRSHLHDAANADARCLKMRTKAAFVLAEMRQRIEAGEAGDVSWWSWFDKNVQRSRKDAEKLLAIASASNPEAAAAEERRKAREGMAEMRKRRAANVSAKMSAEQLERKARVEAIFEKRKREEVERGLQSYDRQVKDYLVAIKAFDQATAVALDAIRKFSPEAKSFTIRKLKAALAHADELIAALGKVDVEIEVDQRREHVNGPNGKAAA